MIDFVCSRLLSLSDHQVDRFLSQFCVVTSQRPGSPLDRVLVQLARRSLRLAVKTYWLLRAMAEDHPENTHVAFMRDQVGGSSAYPPPLAPPPSSPLAQPALLVSGHCSVGAPGRHVGLLVPSVPAARAAAQQGGSSLGRGPSFRALPPRSGYTYKVCPPSRSTRLALHARSEDAAVAHPKSHLGATIVPRGMARTQVRERTFPAIERRRRLRVAHPAQRPVRDAAPSGLPTDAG